MPLVSFTAHTGVEREPIGLSHPFQATACTFTGFISSKNCLFRELNRSVDWIFSNDAVKIQKIRNRYLE